MIIVSCAEKVPDLIDEYEPDTVLSIASIIEVADGIKHYFLNFCDIESPDKNNIAFAATREHINFIRSIKYKTILIHCKQGQRRSPAAALIISGGSSQKMFDNMKTKAPYIQPNKWMLKLAGISIIDIEPRVIPPRGCYFVID